MTRTISPLPVLPGTEDAMPDVRRAAQYIGAHLDDEMTMGDVAAAAGVAHRTLYKHFHDERGTSPMRYARDCRFAHVHEALLQAGPEDSVTTIAVQGASAISAASRSSTASATARCRRRRSAAHA